MPTLQPTSSFLVFPINCLLRAEHENVGREIEREREKEEVDPFPLEANHSEIN